MSKMLTLVIPLSLFFFFKSPFLLLALGIKLKAWLGLGNCSPTEIHLQPIAFVFKTI